LIWNGYIVTVINLKFHAFNFANIESMFSLFEKQASKRIKGSSIIKLQFTAYLEAGANNVNLHVDRQQYF